MKLSCLALMFTVVAPLSAQRRPQVDLLIGAEWTQLPIPVESPFIAHGNLGVAGEIGTRPPWAPPWLRFSARVAYAPARSAPAVPGMTTLGLNVAADVVSSSRFGVLTGIGFEALRFDISAYNQAITGCPPESYCASGLPGGLLYADGWRLGSVLRAQAVLWVHPRAGVYFSPSMGVLVPYGEGGPDDDEGYYALQAGVTVR